jgi:hypothetical protein
MRISFVLHIWIVNNWLSIDTEQASIIGLGFERSSGRLLSIISAY